MTHYDEIDAMNQSTLKEGLVSMKHLKGVIDGTTPRKESAAFAFGTLFHTRVLEPKRFFDTHRVMPAGDGRKTEVKAARAEAEAAAPEGTVWLTQAEWSQIDAMATAVYNHTIVKVFRARGGAEEVLTAELWGVKCKGRVDKISHDKGDGPSLILDVKTADKLTDHAIKNAMAEWGYFIQAAFYLDLATAAYRGTKEFQFKMVMVEKTPPYDVRLITINQWAVAAGRHEYRCLLGDYKRCLETGYWPGISDEDDDLELPAWKMKQYESVDLEACLV